GGAPFSPACSTHASVFTVIAETPLSGFARLGGGKSRDKVTGQVLQDNPRRRHGLRAVRAAQLELGHAVGTIGGEVPVQNATRWTGKPACGVDARVVGRRPAERRDELGAVAARYARGLDGVEEAAPRLQQRTRAAIAARTLAVERGTVGVGRAG